MPENGIHCAPHGDYYFPDLTGPEGCGSRDGWADLHLAFLKECRPHAYGEMLFAGKLFPRGFQALYQRGMEQMR